jgi:hypothetical protein
LILVKHRAYFWAVLGGIVLIGALLLWRAPDEQTLGTGIRSVYVHVAFTWTGMLGLVVAGLLGLIAYILRKRSLQEWSNSIAWLALASFLIGLVMSMISAAINWGAIFWQEPRTNSALQVLAVGLIVQLINGWLTSYRLKGLLAFLLSLFVIWSTSSTPLVLHPGNAASTSPSSAIRLTFLALFILCSLAAIWILIRVRLNRLEANSSPS